MYELPQWLSPDTRYLISKMLIVDPVKRITVADILRHPWTHRGLPNYLTQAVTVVTAPSLLGTLSNLVQTDDVVIPGFGTIDRGIVLELAKALGVEESDVLAGMNLEGENAIKVAYTIAKDRNRTPRKNCTSPCLILLAYSREV